MIAAVNLAFTVTIVVMCAFWAVVCALAAVTSACIIFVPEPGVQAPEG
jgi:hypothetical protein